MIAVEIAGLRRFRSRRQRLGDDGKVADVELLGNHHTLGDVLVGPTGGIKRRRRAGQRFVDALVARAARPISERDDVGAALDLGGLVERGVGDRAPVARGHVAVGVVAVFGVLAAAAST